MVRIWMSEYGNCIWWLRVRVFWFGMVVRMIEKGRDRGEGRGEMGEGRGGGRRGYSVEA